MTNLPIPARRRALKLLNSSAALWTAGTIISSGALFLFFNTQRAWTLSWREIIVFLAALAALTRLLAPPLIRKLGSARKLAMLSLLAGAACLAAIPLVRLPATSPGEDLLTIYAVLYIAFVVLEAFASVAIWTWIYDCVPHRLAGRYLGCREALRLLATAPALLGVGYLTYVWRRDRMHWSGKHDYLLPIWIGVVLLVAAAAMLWWAPENGAVQGRGTRGWKSVLQPLRNRAFSRLLLFAVWTGFFSSLSLPAQDYFPRYVLGWRFLFVFWMLAAVALVQAAVSRWLGKRCDSGGAPRVLLVSQTLAALVPFFFLLASPEESRWMIAALLAMVAQVGIVLGVNTLMLKSAPAEQASQYLATLLCLTAVAVATGTVVGDLLVEALSYQKFRIADQDLDDYDYLFYIGWITRCLGIFFILPLAEPGKPPWRWRARDASGAARLPAEPIRHPLD